MLKVFLKLLRLSFCIPCHTDFCDSHTVQHGEVGFLSSCLHLLSAKRYIHENSTFELSCICIAGRRGVCYDTSVRDHVKKLRPICRRDKNSVSSPPLEPCFDVPNNSPNHLLNSLLLCLEKLAKKSSNQTTHLFSCQNSL